MRTPERAAKTWELREEERILATHWVCWLSWCILYGVSVWWKVGSLEVEDRLLFDFNAGLRTYLLPDELPGVKVAPIAYSRRTNEMR